MLIHKCVLTFPNAKKLSFPYFHKSIAVLYCRSLIFSSPFPFILFSTSHPDYDSIEVDHFEELSVRKYKKSVTLKFLGSEAKKV